MNFIGTDFFLTNEKFWFSSIFFGHQPRDRNVTNLNVLFENFRIAWVAVSGMAVSPLVSNLLGQLEPDLPDKWAVANIIAKLIASLPALSPLVLALVPELGGNASPQTAFRPSKLIIRTSFANQSSTI